jgi:hypothetical protein
MRGGRGTGTLILSIDLELDLSEQEAQVQRRLGEMTRQVLQWTVEHRLPATWAVADPTLSAATDAILAAGCGHEIAVLGDQAWLGAGCGRVRLGRELTRRFDMARRAGIPASTLALRNIEEVPYLDLLLDHGVTGLRGPAVADRRRVQSPQQPPIRFGLWSAPPPWSIPAVRPWWAPTAWLIRREIRRSIRRAAPIHLQLDAPQLIAMPDAVLDAVAATLRYAAAKRAAGQLEVATIGSLAAQALAQRSATPCRSILRPAA